MEKYDKEALWKKKYLKIQEAAYLLGMAPQNTYTMVYKGKFSSEFVEEDGKEVMAIPRDEVTNYFIWRQQDTTRNSVQMLGRFHFSQKQMHGKNNSQVQDMLMLEKGVNWNDLETWKKRGTCFVLNQDGKVVLDDQTPIFTQERNYIDQTLEENTR